MKKNKQVIEGQKNKYAMAVLKNKRHQLRQHYECAKLMKTLNSQGLLLLKREINDIESAIEILKKLRVGKEKEIGEISENIFHKHNSKNYYPKAMLNEMVSKLSNLICPSLDRGEIEKEIMSWIVNHLLRDADDFCYIPIEYPANQKAYKKKKQDLVKDLADKICKSE